jgi:probable selenium-dependent hydroxylase accessory protein YqeC
MTLYEALEPLVSARRAGAIVAFVGAGGKTTAMFEVAAAARRGGRAVLVTTSTAIRDPRTEEGRLFDGYIYEPSRSESLSSRSVGGDALLTALPRPSITVLACGIRPENKITGPHPDNFEGLRPLADFVLVEADGSRGLPLKAPAAHEPVLPPGSDLVVGCLSLEVLGRPAEAELVHRLPLFLELTGLAAGSPIDVPALGRLVTSPQGLFKGCPASTRKVLLLTKADLVDAEARRALSTLALEGTLLPDLILLSAWGVVEVLARTPLRGRTR